MLGWPGAGTAASTCADVQAWLAEHASAGADSLAAGDLHWKEYMEFLDPFDMAGTKFVVERPLDPEVRDGASERSPNAGVGLGEERALAIGKVLSVHIEAPLGCIPGSLKRARSMRQA